MKYLYSLLLMFSTSICYSQQRKIIDLVSNETYELNGGLRSQFGGKSRTTISINNIPSNAIALIYTIQAYKVNESVEKNISLALAIGSMLTGDIALAEILEKSNLPSSTQTVDIYLLPSERDGELFEAKKDGVWRHYKDFDKENCMNGRVVAMWPLQGCSHAVIGIKNPSSLDAIKVVVNVAALVSE